MVQVLLLILKIILWVILAILGLVLLILLLVLFTPICYKADVKYKDSAKVKAKVNFLFVSVKVLFDQEGKELDTIIRVFGIRIGKKKQESDKALDKNLSSDESTEDFDEDVNPWDVETVPSEPDEVPLIQIADSKTSESGISSLANAMKDKAEDTTRKTKTDKHEEEKVSIFTKLSTKLDNFKKLVERFKKFWELDCTVKTRAYLKKYFLGLLKHILPRKIKGYVRYGFDEPCTTGQITGYLSLMPFVYRKGFSLYPDFYNKVIEADVKLKGHIFLGYIIRIIFKISLWKTIIAAIKVFKPKQKKA